MIDFSPAEAEDSLLQQVVALFGASRNAEGDECSALLSRDPFTPYVVYANGAIKLENESAPWCATREQAVREIVAIVAASYPEAKSQRVVWRRKPEYSEWPEFHWQREKLGDAGWMISIRIAAEPFA